MGLFSDMMEEYNELSANAARWKRAADQSHTRAEWLRRRLVEVESLLSHGMVSMNSILIARAKEVAAETVREDMDKNG